MIKRIINRLINSVTKLDTPRIFLNYALEKLNLLASIANYNPSKLVEGSISETNSFREYQDQRIRFYFINENFRDIVDRRKPVIARESEWSKRIINVNAVYVGGGRVARNIVNLEKVMSS